jgi:uncharacterized protein (DUF1810 family)
MSDSYKLDRFLEAQAADYDTALAEIRSGRKQSHWMWYVFPQIAGLGVSETSQYFAIRNLAEAKAYLAHPILGPRLIECADALLALDGRTAREIFGSPDDLKLRSSATLFAHVSPARSAFQRVLEKYFDGASDERTLRLL